MEREQENYIERETYIIIEREQENYREGNKDYGEGTGKL